MKKCPNCGEIIKEGSDVCENCGALSSDLQNLLDELSGKDGEKNKKEKVKLEEIDVSNYIGEKKEEKVTHIEGYEGSYNDNNNITNDNNINNDNDNDKTSSKDSFIIPVVDEEEELKRQYRRKILAVTAVVVLLLVSLGAGYAYSYFDSAKNANKNTIKTKENKDTKKTSTKTKKNTKKVSKKKTEKEKEEEKLLAEAKKKEAEEAARAAEEAKQRAQQAAQKNYLDNSNDVPNADGTYNDEPAHMYEEDVAPGDARLYWVSDRTLTDDMAYNVARKFGADWTVTYIYAKHGLIVDGYTKYGFVGNTSDRSVVESRFNGAERRNVKKLKNY